ncbi:MAG: 50S ribosomal protein L24 [Bacilli bacterium]
MKVKVGDTVLVIAGADKGKQGKVIKTLKKDQKVVVEGVHVVKKHSKPRTTNDKGGIFEIEAPIHVSNVKVITEAEVKEIKKAEKAQEKKEKVEAKEEKKVAKKTTTKKVSKKASN